MNSPIIIRCLHRIEPGSIKDDRIEVDIKRLNQEVVKSLRTTDPSMYHSIPGIHRAKMYLQDVEDFDHSTTEALCSSRAQTLRRNSSKPTSKRTRRSTTVTRRTCISCEAHPDVVMEELLGKLEGMSEDDLTQLFGELED